MECFSRSLKKFNSEIQIVAVEPEASSVISNGHCGPHMIQGIGPGFIPQILDRSVIDEVITVGDVDAYKWTRKITQLEGIMAGISSGAAVCAVDKYIRKKIVNEKVIVTLFPDTGERYLSVPMLYKNRLK